MVQQCYFEIKTNEEPYFSIVLSFNSVGSAKVMLKYCMLDSISLSSALNVVNYQILYVISADILQLGNRMRLIDG